MIKYISILILTLTFTLGNAQQVQGTIKYERQVNWGNILTKMPWMDKIDKVRRKSRSGKRRGNNGAPYMLYFNPENTLYLPLESGPNDWGYSSRVETYIASRDYTKGSTYDQEELLGKKYVIEGEIPSYKWKIKNEIKEIAGYLCMKAETYDPVKEITVAAWFTDQIPASEGPEGYGGLPGMILGLEYNTDDVIIEAKSVTLSEEPVELPFPKKVKGKKISREEFDKKKQASIKKILDRESNPYWNVRY